MDGHETHYDFGLTPNLGDARLDRRLKAIVEKLAAQPGESVPQAQGCWADTKATYRFWDNEAVTPRAILKSQMSATIARIIATTSDILVIQDSTSLCFADHPSVKGLGFTNNKDGLGIHVHTAMAVTEEGSPLGVVDQHTWIRETHRQQPKLEIARTAIEDKESYRWLASERRVLAELPPDHRVVTVADREADITELLVQPRRQGAEVLLRSDADRKIVRNRAGNLSSFLASMSAKRRIDVAVGRSNKRSERTATVEVKFGSVYLRPTPKLRGLRAIPMQVIEAKEVDQPAGEAPIHWRLLTTMTVDSADDACKCIRYYSFRWLIERYHYVLKSGCKIEDLQLETRERIERALATFCIVAWRILYLRYAERSFADETPATVALSPSEWKALTCHHHKIARPPATPPTLREATLWIAQLGGFLARRRDGHPGVKVLWRGLRRLEDIAEAYELFSGDAGNA